MILHIPHCSRIIPAEWRHVFVLTQRELEAELNHMTDAFTDEMFDRPGTKRVVFPVSRLLVDPERFLDDSSEPMSAKGMGVVYSQTSQGQPLKRRVSAAERAELICQYYRPHHQALTEAVQAELDRTGSALLIDCHSFPSRPLPCDVDQMTERPDFCLGTDTLHTPAWLVDSALAEIARQDSSVEVNRPYAGVLVPEAFYGKDRRVAALMIEVNRNLYMDKQNGEKTKDFGVVRARVGRLLEAVESGLRTSVQSL